MRREGFMVPVLYGLICLIWGSTWLVIKIGLGGMPPFLGAGLRFTLASAVLFMMVRARGTKIALDRSGRITVWSCGIFGFALSYACVYWAEQHISSGMSALLYCMMPLFVVLLSRFWTRAETLSARKIAGILIAMAGTAVLFRPAAAGASSQLAGMAVALASVFISSANLVVVKKYGRDLDVFVMNALGMTIAAVLLLALSGWAESGAAVVWSRVNVFAIVYLALIGTVMAFSSYYWLAKVMDATYLSLITLICPVVALFLGAVFLKETIPPGAWTGMAAVMSGVAIAIVPRRG